jgi:hypothetical protein
MRFPVAPLLATASFTTVVICCLGAASALHALYKPHEFHNMEASIWTSSPVRVDRANQNFERLAAVPSVSAPIPMLAMNDQLTDQSAANQTSLTASASIEVASAVGTPGNEACQRKYRSYRAEDNSYQPLSGGPRRQCDIPSEGASVENAQQSASTVASPTNSSPDHRSWCQSRYTSYNSADDTYQPFSGGKRRTCMSPTAVASPG